LPNLFHSVAYDKNEMSQVYSEIMCSLIVFDVNDCTVTTSDVLNAILKLRPGESNDEYLGS